MKKILVLVTILALAGLCACGFGKRASVNSATTATVKPGQTTKKVTPTTKKVTPTTKKVPTTTKKQTKKVVKKIVKKKVKFSKKMKYAKYSKIHSGKAVLYKHTWGKRKVVAVNAGHGTRGGERYKTLCHPDGSPKLVSGSTKAGAKYSPSISGGTSLKGKGEAAATLSEAKILRDKLLKAGFDVLMIREKSNVQLDNIARTLLANKYADCHIAIHYDSSSSNKGAFFLSVPNNKHYRNMEPVKSHWRQHNKFGRSVIWGIRKCGQKVCGSGSMAMDLTQTSYSTVPSIDLEVGDKATSTSKKSQTKMAKAITKGIKKYFKKKK